MEPTKDDGLTPEELALFGAPPAVQTATPAPAAVETVAVLPPDAPTSTATPVPLPEAPKKRGPGRPKKSLITDVAAGETEEQATARQALEQGKAYELPSGETGTFTCVTNGEQASFKTEKGVELVPPGVEVKPAPEPKKATLDLAFTCAAKVEFDPKTKALIAALNAFIE